MFHRKQKLIEKRKWNLMWDMWRRGKIPSPYAELLQYECEINNDGHSLYFFNLAHCGNLKENVETVLSFLPNPLHDNLKRGFDAFCAIADNRYMDPFNEYDEDDEYIDLFNECDELFHQNEQIIIDRLKAYANALTTE